MGLYSTWADIFAKNSLSPMCLQGFVNFYSFENVWKILAVFYLGGYFRKKIA